MGRRGRQGLRATRTGIEPELEQIEQTAGAGVAVMRFACTNVGQLDMALPSQHVHHSNSITTPDSTIMMLNKARAHLGVKDPRQPAHVTVYNAAGRTHRHYENLATDVQLSALTTNEACMTIVLWDRQIAAAAPLATTVLLCDALEGRRMNVYLDCQSASGSVPSQRLKLGAIHLKFTMHGCTSAVVESAQARLTAWATGHLRNQRSASLHPQDSHITQFQMTMFKAAILRLGVELFSQNDTKLS